MKPDRVHKTPCGIRKLTAAFVSKIGVFSRFSWSLDFGAKMAEFPLLVLQIWRSRKRVAIQIQLMNINVSECKYYCLHLVPKFGDMCDRQNWRLHPTVEWTVFQTMKSIVILCLKSGAHPPLRSLRIAWLEGIVTSGRQQRNAVFDPFDTP